MANESIESKQEPIILPAMGKYYLKEASQSTAPEENKSTKKRMVFRPKLNNQDKRLGNKGNTLSLNLSFKN